MTSLFIFFLKEKMMKEKFFGLRELKGLLLNVFNSSILKLL